MINRYDYILILYYYLYYYLFYYLSCFIAPVPHSRGRENTCPNCPNCHSSARTGNDRPRRL